MHVNRRTVLGSVSLVNRTRKRSFTRRLINEATVTIRRLIALERATRNLECTRSIIEDGSSVAIHGLIRLDGATSYINVSTRGVEHATSIGCLIVVQGAGTDVNGAALNIEYAAVHGCIAIHSRTGLNIHRATCHEDRATTCSGYRTISGTN